MPAAPSMIALIAIAMVKLHPFNCDEFTMALGVDKISHPLKLPYTRPKSETPDVGGVWRFGAYRIGTEPANLRGTVVFADLEYDYGR